MPHAARKLPIGKAERAARVQLAACYRIFDHLGSTEMIFNHSTLRGTLNPIRPGVFAQTVRESGPGEKRTCEDVFAAMQRIVDAKDPSYRD